MKVNWFLIFYILISTAFSTKEVSAQNKKYTLSVLNIVLESDFLTYSDSRILTERFAQEIASAGLFQTLAQERMEGKLFQKNIDPYGCKSRRCALLAGRALGVQLVIFGKVEERGSKYIFETSMMHIGSGEILRTHREEYINDLGEVFNDLLPYTQKLQGLQKASATPKPAPKVERSTQPLTEKQPGSEESIERKPVEAEQTNPGSSSGYYDNSGKRFNWKLIGIGALVAGGVGTGLILISGDGGTTGPINSGVLPGPPSFP